MRKREPLSNSTRHLPPILGAIQFFVAVAVAQIPAISDGSFSFTGFSDLRNLNRSSQKSSHGSGGEILAPMNESAKPRMPPRTATMPVIRKNRDTSGDGSLSKAKNAASPKARMYTPSNVAPASRIALANNREDCPKLSVLFTKNGREPGTWVFPKPLPQVSAVSSRRPRRGLQRRSRRAT